MNYWFDWIESLCRDGRTPCAHRETPDEGLPTQKQSTGLFLLPVLRFASLGISLPAGSDKGSSPLTSQGTLSLDPARALPLDPARALPLDPATFEKVDETFKSLLLIDSFDLSYFS